ncbi:hypothetical protein GCM10011383_32530 [Hymenobacter cavernae]|uniref:Gliding motility-associated C-terminal domain-containing protein n=1 Tax=Hymenobacter cavernae TaxID=2044852 RepID=A0ABQ1UJF7_9BACT|nr:hypothetical protein GCM10011383_32530 [Hymenobacter cavernae]
MLLALWVSLPFLLLLTAPIARASHLRAGDIQAKVDTTAGRNPRRIFFKMILYTDNNPASVRQPTATIFFGDGTSSGVEAIKRSTNDPIRVSNTTDLNVYYFEHTYNALGTYTVSFIGENRNKDVLNIPDSFNRSFYISTTITLDPALGFNRSPILTAPAIDRAGRNQVFLHNPAAYDADGDSLSYKLVPCQYVPEGVEGTVPPRGTNRPNNQVCPGYTYPDNPSFGGASVPYSGPPSDPGGGPVRFTQNVRTGQIVWNAPNTLGYYNAAFVVEEWRRIAGAPARRIGQVIRDMQIIVEGNNNLRPVIKVPNDTCVVAGTTVSRVITATDPDRNPVNLFAYSGIIPPATFRQTTLGPPTAQGTFTWTTDCSNIASEPTQIVFKAQDNPTSGSPLIDERAWRITVIGPAPTNFVAQRLPNSPSTTVLTWDRYVCQNPGAQILIYRKEGPSNWQPGPCETGIPASTGFVQIGAVNGNQTTFTDANNSGRGSTFCYRIYVSFPRPAGGASLASAEACVTLEGPRTVLTHVTVDRTDTVAGQITVRWSKASSSDPIALPATYRLFRAPAGSTVFTLARETNDLNDTTYVDSGLNTRDNGYTYRLQFTPRGVTNPDVPPTASSVRLSGQANEGATQVNLAWSYTVPWNNATPERPTTIYRRDPGSTTFVAVGTVPSGATGGSYVDRSPGLVRGQTYRYYVLTSGTYNTPRLPDPLLNQSQEVDVEYVPVPCAPVLTVANNCEALAATVLTRAGVFPAPGETYTNTLRWQLGANSPTGCDNSDIDHYDLFYKLNGESSYQFLASTKEQQYAHTNLETQTYCYTVQAVNKYNRRSLPSDSVCADNCLLFLLPNIFTPNGDGVNDTFRPKVASPLRRVHFTAYNRWGVKVYESQSNPRIDWSGEGANGEGTSGGKVSEGVYYYQAEVEFADLNGTKKTFKGWVQINR